MVDIAVTVNLKSNARLLQSRYICLSYSDRTRVLGAVSDVVISRAGLEGGDVRGGGWTGECAGALHKGGQRAM